MFKANLENYKKNCDSISECNFWDVSRIVLDKIEGPSYLDSKEKRKSYIVVVMRCTPLALQIYC